MLENTSMRGYTWQYYQKVDSPEIKCRVSEKKSRFGRGHSSCEASQALETGESVHFDKL